MEKEIVKTYTNGEVTVRWEPAKCIHSARCIKGLPNVFDTGQRPWISLEGSSTTNIIAQVDKCPSGALSHYLNSTVEAIAEVAAEQIIEVMPNGPLLVYGNITLKHADGTTEQKHKVSAFCRCGASANKPFCDGAHRKAGFEG